MNSAEEGEARVVFKNAHSVGLIMCGQSHVKLQLKDGFNVVLTSERRKFENDDDGVNKHRKIHVTWDRGEDITADDLREFFRYGGIVNIDLMEETDAVIAFATMQPVKEILGGEEVVSFYIGNKAVRVYPYNPDHEA